MADANRAVKLVVTLTVIGLMVAFLLPVAIGAVSGPDSTTITQDTTETTELKNGLNATLDSVDTTADTASYTITANGDSTTATVDNGTSTTVTVDGADVTISPESISTGQATTEYEYPTTYGWGTGASAMWAIIPVMIVLAAFLFIVGVAMKRAP